jgi:hypothetical protein
LATPLECTGADHALAAGAAGAIDAGRAAGAAANGGGDSAPLPGVKACGADEITGLDTCRIGGIAGGIGGIETVGGRGAAFGGASTIVSPSRTGGGATTGDAITIVESPTAIPVGSAIGITGARASDGEGASGMPLMVPAA